MHIFIIVLVHNTCTHNNGYVEIEKVKCNINVIISSQHASIYIIIHKMYYAFIHHLFYKYNKFWIHTSV